MSIQTKRRIHVSKGRKAIIPKQIMIPRIGTNGTNGVLNDRGASGILTRITQTPKHTNTKASNVPILTISPTTRAGTKAANKLTNTMNNKFDLYGVLNFG